MVSSPYLFSVILAIIEFILLLTGVRRKSTKTLLFYVILLVCNLGYYSVSISQSLEEAILANKIVYVGSIFMPYIMLLTIAEFCKTKLPHWLVIVLFCFTMIVMMMAFTVGFSDMYYKEVWITHYKSIFSRRGVTVLHKLYGPMHAFFPALMIGELGLSVAVVWRALKGENRVSKQNAITLLTMFGVALTVYILQSVFKSRFDYMSYIYVILSAVFLNLSLEVQFYDAYNGFFRDQDGTIERGYITYNRGFRLMDYTELPAMVFPELKSVRFGDYIYDTDTDYYKEIHNWLRNIAEDSSKKREMSFTKDDRYYVVRMNELTVMTDTLGGYMISIDDETRDHENIRLLEENNRLLAKDAATDNMTGLLNKGASESEIGKIISSGAHATLMMLDLDYFKLVNDLHGHDAGDKVLIAFAKMLQGIARATDVIGRIGGDEFLICYKGWQTEESLGRYTTQLNDQLQTMAHELTGDGADIPLGVSVGVAFIPQCGSTYSEVKNCADRALYLVKQNGKHGMIVFHDASKNARQEDSTESKQPIDHVLATLEERNVLPGSFEISSEALAPVYRIFKRCYANSEAPCSVAIFRLEQENADESICDEFLALLQKTCRQKDVVAKRKPFSFVAIMPDTDEAGCRKACENITKEWKQLYGAEYPVLSDVKTI